MRFLLLFSRQGKLRLQKWFTALSDRDKKKIIRDVTQMVLARPPKACNFLQWRDLKIVYRRYASLYFCCGLEEEDNELLTLELLHRYVELLDQYFGNVCELDIIFNFEKAYFILDEFVIGGEVQETSKASVAKSMEEADSLQEMRFLLLFSRQGKLRLQKWFTALSDRDKKKIIRDVTQMVLARPPKACNFLQWRDLKIVYRRYASLYFCCGLEEEDNELLTLELLHRYVELLDQYFGNVCELDIIFNFEKAYFILDEFVIGGEVQETSKASVAKSMEEADSLQETMEEYLNKPTY
ncbi:AP-1 complex subunit sigma-2 [Pimephales promelas]|nr:AP-1 complex subunit sigma-2 [Pimephales promelas]